MRDLRSALEARLQQFEPPTDGLPRLQALRRRRRRNQRLVAAALALAVAGGAMFALTRAFRTEPPRPVPISPPVTPETVGRLRAAWTGQVARETTSSVVAAGGSIYVHTSQGGLAVFGATCASSTCSPSRTAVLGGHDTGADTPPFVTMGRVFVTSDRLQVFAPGCATSGRHCSPFVVEDPPVRFGQLSAPTVSGGTVYAVAQDGRLVAYRADCSSPTGCGPLWSARTGSRLPHSAPSANSAPAVDDGLVYVLSDRLYAFPVSCGGSERCRPRWTARVNDNFTAPVAAEGMVYVSHGDRLYAFSAGCGSNGATCSPSWTFRDPAGAFLTTPATDGGLVFVAGNELFALDPRCGTGGHECSPAWTGQIGPRKATAPPAVGSGLVFVSTNRLLAFSQTCSAATCEPLWQSTTFGSPLGRAAIGQRFVVVTDSSGRLTVFEVRPRA